MIPKRRLFLHLGTHKTGTTSIQYMLFERRAELAALGVQVIRDHPSHRGNITNCSSVAHAFIRPELMTPTRLAGRALCSFGSEALIAYLKKQLGEIAGCGLISSEAFCYLRTSEEQDALHRCIDEAELEVTAIVFFRRESEWRRSWAAQLSKLNSANDLGTAGLVADWYFDRERITEFWRQTGRLIVLDYEEAVARDGTVIPSFLDAIGMPRSLNSAKYRLNQSQPT